MRIEDVPLPTAGDDGLVLKVHSCAICGTDTRHYRGTYGPGRYPTVLGHEASGEVVEVGRRAGSYEVGERLTFWVSLGCFAEYVRIEPGNVAVGRLRDEMTWEQGANTQLLCACLRAVDCASIQDSERVLVLGCGPVGLLTLQGAKAHARPAAVAATDLFENRIALAEHVGADAALSGRDPDWAQQVVDRIGEVDVVFDCLDDDLSPGRNAGEKLPSAMKRGGRIIVLSLSDEPRYPSPQGVLNKLVSVQPSFVPLGRSRELMHAAVEMVADGRVDVHSFVTHRLRLERAAEGIEMTRERPGEVVKVMVEAGE
jgi:threonine dehydrogenase-like Zn-dependent dehydrogenase